MEPKLNGKEAKPKKLKSKKNEDGSEEDSPAIQSKERSQSQKNKPKTTRCASKAALLCRDHLADGKKVKKKKLEKDKDEPEKDKEPKKKVKSAPKKKKGT